MLRDRMSGRAGRLVQWGDGKSGPSLQGDPDQPLKSEDQWPSSKAQGSQPLRRRCKSGLVLSLFIRNAKPCVYRLGRKCLPTANGREERMANNSAVKKL